MIKLVSVNKYFNKKKENQIHVIDNTSIELPTKGLVTFLGNSGCGKTTLLNAIGGLDKVDSGDIFIDDEKMTVRSNSKRDDIRNIHVGYIFQNYNLIEDATVYENVALVLKMMGIKKDAEIDERVSYILNKVGIYKYRNRPAKMLSGGERQRVGIARAIVKNPKIIIADEPTGNLDSKNTIEIMNIIKAISKEKLIILVTHEREIAEFYADRIVEIVDGRIVSDRENQHDRNLDYRLENKIYLKDLPVQDELAKGNVKVKYYSDKDEKIDISVIIKNNNIYIETSNKLAEGSASMELVDDHYKMLSKDVYEEYEFDYEKLIDKGFMPKYTSVMSPLASVTSGFRKVRSYSMIKKILLVGFMLASVFIIYAISNIAGITNITDNKFVKVNHNYLTVTTSKANVKAFQQYENMEGVDYVLPGDSMASFVLPLNDYYQSFNAKTNITGSLSATNLLNEKDLSDGKLPANKKQIVVDKMVIDTLQNQGMPKHIGLKDYADFVGRKVVLPRLGKFEIVGISDLMSPSIYADKSMMFDILENQPAEGESDSQAGFDEDSLASTTNVIQYKWGKNQIKIVKGRAPTEDYEVLVNETLQYESPMGKTVTQKVNGKKLTVVGYYSNSLEDNSYYVNEDTAKYNLIAGSKDIIVSPYNKAELYQKLSAENAKVEDNYARDRQNYIDGIKKNIIATLIVAFVILAVSLIEIFLMLRSSFLSRIKEVGVLRAIGLKKKDVYKMFVGEIIAITAITAIPSMALMAYILNGVSKLPFVGQQYLMNPAIFLGSMALVFVFNVLVGLLPVFETLRKTPAQILSRNDVN